MGFFNNLFNKCKDTEEVVYTKDNWYEELFMQSAIALETNEAFLNSSLKSELDVINLPAFHKFFKSLLELPINNTISSFELPCFSELLTFLKTNNIASRNYNGDIMLGEYLSRDDFRDFTNLNHYLRYSFKQVSSEYDLSKNPIIYKYLNDVIVQLRAGTSPDYNSNNEYSAKYKESQRLNGSNCKLSLNAFRYMYEDSLKNDITMDEFTFLNCMFPYTLKKMLESKSNGIYLTIDSVVNTLGDSTDKNSPFYIDPEKQPDLYNSMIRDCLNYLNTYFVDLNKELYHVFKTDDSNIMNSHLNITTYSGTGTSDCHWKEDVFLKIDKIIYSLAFFKMLLKMIDQDKGLLKHCKINYSTQVFIIDGLVYHFNKNHLSYDECLKLLSAFKNDTTYLGGNDYPNEIYLHFLNTVDKY